MVKSIMFAVLSVALVSPFPRIAQIRLGLQTAASVPQDPSAVGHLDLHKRHRDGEAGPDEFNNAYSPAQAIKRLDQMRGFLVSFRRLTETVTSRLSQAELKAAGNTSGEIQTIGFRNIPLVVEGTLLKQDYQLRQVQYELAQLKRDRSEISSQELDRVRAAYAEATRQFQIFWDTKLPTD